MKRLALVLLLSAAVAADLQDDLAAAVDLPTPGARAKAARELAARKEVPLADWLAAMRAFRPPVSRTRAPTPTMKRFHGVLQLPASYDPARPAPLLLALHGTGGTGEQAAAYWGRIAGALGMIVLAPTRNGENRGYTFSAEEREEALAALRWARRRFNVDENRIHITGISRGGHMTWDLGLRFPDRFASLAPMIGGPRLDPTRGQNNLRFLENVLPIPIRDLQGERDDPHLLFNLRYAFKRLETLGARDARLITFPELGHSFRYEAVDWKTFFHDARRDPLPTRIVRLSAGRPGEGRALWIEILETARDIREAIRIRVSAETWNALDNAGKRRFLARAALKKTARIEAVMRGPGLFEVKSRGVRRFRILLSRTMFSPNAPIEVIWNGRRRMRKLKPSPRVALLNFVERFDRTFLPVAEFRIP